MTFLIRTLTFLVMAAFLSACNNEKTADCKKVDVTEVAQFAVEKTADGYALVLPPSLLAGFPKTAEFSITLIDVNKQSSEVTGKGMVTTKNTLEIVTPTVFDLESILRSKLDSIDIVQVGAGTGTASSNCGGCSRAPSLNIFGDESICYCVHDEMPMKDLEPTTLPTQN